MAFYRRGLGLASDEPWDLGAAAQLLRGERFSREDPWMKGRRRASVASAATRSIVRPRHLAEILGHHCLREDDQAVDAYVSSRLNRRLILSTILATRILTCGYMHGS